MEWEPNKEPDYDFSDNTAGGPITKEDVDAVYGQGSYVRLQDEHKMPWLSDEYYVFEAWRRLPNGFSIFAQNFMATFAKPLLCAGRFISTKFNLKTMNYESFQNQRNKLGNLYNVKRISDGKEVLRGATYNKVIDLIGEDKHLYEIYFY